jgi:RimJ/RimL family protein N-acetyltransferase
MEYVAGSLEGNRVVALIRPENFPSQGLALKLGMSLEKSTHYADFLHLVFVAWFNQQTQIHTQPNGAA